MGVVVMPPRSGTSGSRISPAWPLASARQLGDREPDFEQHVADERREQRHPERDELLGVVGVGDRLVRRARLLVEADDGDAVDADGLEELGAVPGDPVEEQVVGAPPVDAGEQRRRVGEDLTEHLEAQAVLDEARSGRGGRVVLALDDAEGGERVEHRRDRDREVVDEQQLEDPLREIGEELVGLDSGRRGVEVVEGPVHAGGGVEQREHLLDLRVVAQRVDRDQARVDRRRERGVRRGKVLGVPAQPEHERAEPLDARDRVAQRRHGAREMAGDELEGAVLLGHQYAYSLEYIASRSPCLVGSIISTSTYRHT